MNMKSIVITTRGKSILKRLSKFWFLKRISKQRFNQELKKLLTGKQINLMRESGKGSYDLMQQPSNPVFFNTNNSTLLPIKNQSDLIFDLPLLKQPMIISLTKFLKLTPSSHENTRTPIKISYLIRISSFLINPLQVKKCKKVKMPYD